MHTTARRAAAAACALTGAITATLAIAGGPARASAATPAVTPLSTGHSQWAWGYPSPQGQDLQAVAFQGTTGYAVGTFGTILRSADAGQTWTGLTTPTTDDLDLVQELSPTTVIAAGGCSAVESTDSGASFSQMPLGLAGGGACSNPVAGIAFSDADHGYVELGDGTLLYTTDAGRTLQSKTSAPLGSGRATGLAFESATTGLAVSSSGLIERTTDGGNSWTQVESAPAGLNGVTVVSPTLAYAVGDSGELLQSTDGGATWTRLALTVQGGGALPDLTSITCADAQDCLITTARSNALVRTTDGGQTAAIVTASNGALTGVAYTTGTTVVGVGELGATSISQDAGQTFPTISSDAMATAAPTGTLTAGLAPGSAYVTEQDGVAATTDAGRSWTLDRVPGDGVASAAFTSADDGYALGVDGVLRHTTDGGVSWSAFAAGHSSESQLVAPSPHRLLLAGPRGIFASTDGGGDFHRVRGRLLGHGRRGRRVSSLRLNHAFAVHGAVVAYQGGSADSIIVSGDGGRRWRAIPAPPHPAHSAIDVSATGPSRLWVYANSTLWATSDAGRHWHTLRALGRWLVGNRPSEPFPGAVSFSSRRDGIVMAGGLFSGSVSADPTLGQVSVLRTRDGGRTWIPEVIAGERIDTQQSVLATARGDLAQLDVAALPSGGTGPEVGFFTTAGTKPATRHTALHVRFAHRRMSARALAHAGHRVRVTGRVRPVLSASERVAVSYQVDGHTWQMRAVRLGSDGSFRLTLAHVHASAQVVAQAVGTSTVSGAGTPVARFSVRRH